MGDKKERERERVRQNSPVCLELLDHRDDRVSGGGDGRHHNYIPHINQIINRFACRISKCVCVSVRVLENIRDCSDISLHLHRSLVPSLSLSRSFFPLNDKGPLGQTVSSSLDWSINARASRMHWKQKTKQKKKKEKNDILSKVWTDVHTQTHVI